MNNEETKLYNRSLNYLFKVLTKLSVSKGSKKLELDDDVSLTQVYFVIN